MACPKIKHGMEIKLTAVFRKFPEGYAASRVKLDTMEPLDATRIDRRIIAIIRDLRKEGRL